MYYAREFCPVCHWERKNDQIINDYIVNIDPKTSYYRNFELRPLNNKKIDYHIINNSSSSQICRGVYPEGTTREEVLKLVNGTFGGRFNYFDDGKFEYVAYTD